MDTPHAFPAIGQNFGILIATLKRLMAAYAGLDPRRSPTSLRVWNYLAGLLRRFEVLLRDPTANPARLGSRRSGPPHRTIQQGSCSPPAMGG